jgi:hypothetical protein
MMYGLLSFIQFCLDVIAQITGLFAGVYLANASWRDERFSYALEIKMRTIFFGLLLLACLVNVSLFPILAFIGFMMMGGLLSLFFAFMDRPINVPRD